jgi:hypothetical protein
MYKAPNYAAVIMLKVPVGSQQGLRTQPVNIAGVDTMIHGRNYVICDLGGKSPRNKVPHRLVGVNRLGPRGQLDWLRHNTSHEFVKDRFRKQCPKVRVEL